MNITGRSRASTYVYASPDPKSRVIEVLRPNDPVEVQGEAGEMFEVESKRLLPPVGGYIPKSSLARQIPKVEVFPMIDMRDGTSLDPAPPDLLAVEFEAWLHTQGEPTWLFEDGNAPFLLGDGMRKAFETHRESWKEWFAEIVDNNMLQRATLGDWYTVISGGREMWSFRPERIFKEPTERSMALGWASPTDILHWTGRVRYSEKEWKYKLWYEVELTKLNRTIKGWYKADLLEEFVLPEVFVESNDRAGIAALFDMTQSKLRLPADPEIAEARIEKRNAYQYIDIQKAFEIMGWASLQYMTRIPPSPMGKFRVKATALRLRSGPGTSNSIIGMLYKNNIVIGDETVGNWVRLTTEDNITGWSHKGYLELTEELPPPADAHEEYRVDTASLDIHEGPNADHLKIGSLRRGEVIKGLAISPDEEWLQVQIGAGTGRKRVKFNLCGQFCVAAVCGVDVIPVVRRWYHSSRRGKTVIDGDRGTVIYDLQEMLDLFNVKSETFQPEPSVAPATPGYLENMLMSGKKAIIGVGITKKGELAYNASIRHWMVVTDIVRMGNSGWVRVYNSFFNQEEVYPYQRIFNTGSSTGISLWVDAPQNTNTEHGIQGTMGNQNISAL
ncbi:MAG TPA: SH3 domain-containing protein [Anaerolineales bacterium]